MLKSVSKRCTEKLRTHGSVEKKSRPSWQKSLQDNRTAFGPLFNFVRNWSSKFKPHIELLAGT